ncbi:MAG: hypothetical protein LBB08_02215 [Rickettsiales bacterium]|jgi:hypothetical protein|nr:hypothetical protein [Rickettsiales bacterium]
MKKISALFFLWPAAASATLRCTASGYVAVKSGEACPGGYKELGTVEDSCPAGKKEWGTITNFSFPYSDSKGTGSCSVRE